MATKENRLLKNTNIKIKEGKEKYSMFPYQEEAIKNLEKLDKVYDTYRTLVVVPTGGGKTRIAVEYLNRNVLNRQGTKVLWICERLSLLTQAHHSFVDHTYRDSLEHGGKPFKASEITAHVFSSQDTSFREEYKSEDVQMVFVTKQTLCKMFGFADNSGKQKEIDESFKDWLENPDELTVIIDEAHHAVGDDYRNIISTLLSMVQKKKIHIIGLTATPKNTNGSRIEEIFLHGIDLKSEMPTDKTCYASRVSINQLIAEGYLAKPFLAKKKDSSPEKLSDRKLCNRIIDTYEKGVCALALETPSSQDEDTKVPKELNPNNSFGQTVIFVKSREVARLLWSKFLAHEIDCGISISTDGNNDLTQYKNLQDYINKDLSSDQIVKIYEERYAKNILPVIVSVDKFKEGVDVPKTQTVFIARDSSTEISVTQMVGRALRGVLQGGTSEAYLVEFEDEQLNKILWEVPERRDDLKDFYKILLGEQAPPTTAGNTIPSALQPIDLKSLNALIADNEKKINNAISAIIENLCNYMPMQSSPADEGDLIIPNEVIGIDIPIGYVTFGQRYLLVWDKTEKPLQDIRNALDSLGVNDLRKLWDEHGISATSLRRYVKAKKKYASLHDISREIIYENIYWNYVHTMLFYIFEVNKGKEDEAIKKMQEQDIEVERFVDYKKPELCEIADQIITGAFDGEIDDFLNQQWKKYGTALSNQSNQLGVSELYFKAYFKQFYMKTAEVKQDIAESDYFRIRLYRDGRKRENLVKLLQLILKGGVAQNVYSDTFDFYDVFGGTGTMTVSLKDTVKGKRHLNEFDVVVAKALYFIKKYEHRLPDDFKKTFAEFNDKWYDIIKDMKTSIDQKKMYAHLKSIFENTEYRERYGKDATEDKGVKDIIDNWKGINYDTKYDNKQKRITANRESLYEAVGAKDPKIMSMERGYLEKRYEELLILEEVLKKPEAQNVVEMYLALYVSFEDYIKQMNDDEKTTKEQREAWQNQINSDTLKLTPRDRLLVFAFLYVHSFASYIVSKSSEAGVDPKGIERFKKLLSGEETWLDEFSDRLQDVDITSKDFKEIVPETSDNESNNKVYYLDPPYFLTNQYACEFSDENHLEMLKRLREAEYNWIFSCKSKETNESLSKRSKKAKERYIHTEKGKLFEEYFKLFLYDESEKEIVEENKTYIEVSADMRHKKRNDLYVYYIEPLEDNYYEIMISNIPPNKDDAQVLKSYNFKCEEFKSFFKNHCKYKI
ncbi:DEAD/DEAH box helicase family protein [Faecalimonas umbilicata]|uniref:DEAD/DEAH box helicase family protein n=1 Tax=Faecalimonas umbilicata TaxID=1912855 RepID=UPI0022E78455|nr:DEAD/DEAH box helicase family protein [Faecalimonas umbilicata]